ncbi:MAG TPA: hypothetical protein PKN33_05640 [Phycisphaerae bacterium]|nr:hypothetical protein [Phycisphaerae bacterium]
MTVAAHESKRLQRVAAFFLIAMSLMVFRGCSAFVGYQQTIKVRVAGVESGAPIANARIYRIYKAGESIDGEIFETDEDGLADIIQRTYVPCGVALADPRCNEVVYEDVVTGTSGNLIVEEGDTVDAIDVEFQEGNVKSGERYSIEIISISEPVDLDDKELDMDE